VQYMENNSVHRPESKETERLRVEMRGFCKRLLEGNKEVLKRIQNDLERLEKNGKVNQLEVKEKASQSDAVVAFINENSEIISACMHLLQDAELERIKTDLENVEDELTRIFVRFSNLEGSQTERSDRRMSISRGSFNLAAQLDELKQLSQSLPAMRSDNEAEEEFDSILSLLGSASGPKKTPPPPPGKSPTKLPTTKPQPPPPTFTPGKVNPVGRSPSGTLGSGKAPTVPPDIKTGNRQSSGTIGNSKTPSLSSSSSSTSTPDITPTPSRTGTTAAQQLDIFLDGNPVSIGLIFVTETTSIEEARGLINDIDEAPAKFIFLSGPSKVSSKQEAKYTVFQVAKANGGKIIIK